MNEERRDPTAEQLPTLAEILEEDEEAQAELERRLGRRERKLWKARARMPMHGKHLLRSRQRQHKRRNEHIREW